MFDDQMTDDFNNEVTKLKYAAVFYHGGPIYKDEQGWRMYFASMPLMPLLFALPYKIIGYGGVFIFRVILSALLFVMLSRIMSFFTRDTWLAWASCLLVGTTASLFFYIHTFWVEFLGGFILTAGIYFLLLERRNTRLVSCICFALLPWLNLRYFVIPLATALMHLFLKDISYREKILNMLTVVIVAGLIFPFNLAHSKNLLPGSAVPQVATVMLENSQDLPSESTGILSIIPRFFKNRSGIFKEVLNVFFSGRNGLFIYNPLMLLALFGLFRLPMQLKVPILAYVVFIMIKPGSDEGFLPPRYFCSALPVMAVGYVKTLNLKCFQKWRIVLAWPAIFISFIGYVYRTLIQKGFLRNAFFGLSLKPGFTIKEIAFSVFYGIVIFYLYRLQKQE
jgi:hypothetical protein